MISNGHAMCNNEAINGMLTQQCNFPVELITVNYCSDDNTDNIIKTGILNHSNGNLIKHKLNNKILE